MPHYIFLSPEGWTTTPKDTEIENLQVLGFADGASPHIAFLNFAQDNSHLKSFGFEEVIAMRLTNCKEHRYSLKHLK
jgi:hypothetical protein